MPLLRQLSIPLLLLAATAGPVYWALPEGLAPARSLGIVLGWAGCGLLLASLLLMLREPRLAQGLGGLERMYRWHHRAGMAAYVALLAHPLLLAADAWPAQPLLAWQTLSPFGQDWPVWFGWLALLLLMAGLALTFDQRIAYRTWRWLHVGLGIAVLSGLLHLVLLGIEQPVWPIFGLAALFLGWRIVREDLGLAARPYIVHSVSPVAEGMVEIVLKPLADGMAATPGQFALVAFFDGPGFRGCGEFHPFTVSAVGAAGEIRFGVKALGDCTRRIQSIVPGVLARVHGAFGSFLADRPAAPQLWVAGGIGITPFLAQLRAGPLEQPTRLLYLYRSEPDAAFLPELRALTAQDPKLSLRAVATGPTPPDLHALLPEAPGLAQHDCYLCGPPGMVAGLQKVLNERGIAPRHIHFENFEFR
ncbi:MAG: ferric reductase-like transmembrane domain-containing protein [Dechloromonas sp.]|nr:ferric reductase-like transmembrane domain-containing protein [Dechloromonas sp.]